LIANVSIAICTIGDITLDWHNTSVSSCWVFKSESGAIDTISIVFVESSIANVTLSDSTNLAILHGANILLKNTLSAGIFDITIAASVTNISITISTVWNCAYKLTLSCSIHVIACITSSTDISITIGAVCNCADSLLKDTETICKDIP